MHFVLSLVFAISALVAIGNTADLTRLSRATGAEVVEAVVNIIRESCLFADDRRFLRRLAYVESQDGSAPKTFRNGYYGGIWQIDEQEFNATQYQSSLQSQYAIIRNVMGINWNYVRWEDLTKPLYSGLAAALFTILRRGHSDLSWKAEEQGQFWGHWFHGGSPANNFTQLATILDLGCKTNQEVDLVFVLDTSSSLSGDDFTRAIRFINQVVDGFEISRIKTQVSVVTFSSGARIQFWLNSYGYLAGLHSGINSVQNVAGGTATDQGIDQAVNNVFDPIHGARSNAVKVMVVLTDGKSDDDLNTVHAADRAHDSGIVTFSVGIGSAIDRSEINAIASSPSCTHAYTVKTFEDIKFMKEEIQKATCIAPLYINTTYTCVLDRCPPLAVLTGLTGSTIETNVTCGGMNVYAAINNPYPGPAQYETMLTTLFNQPSQTFFNVSGQTLFITFKNNQIFNGSKNCVATITPYIGDKTDKTIVVKCFQNGVEIPCDSSYFNCTEKWNFGNPCTSANILAGKTRFPHPYESNKFLMCDLSGKLYVVICPLGEVFFADCSQCLGENTTVSTDCKIPIPSHIANPCTRANILANKMFFEYPGDDHKFIHCDVWGHPWERSCPAGEIWGQDLETCFVPSMYSPCRYHKDGDPYLYPHQCDPHKYIHCDTNHQSFVQSCGPNFLFYIPSRTCVPTGTYNTSTYVNTCNGVTAAYITVGQGVTRPVTTYPSNNGGTTNLNGYEYSSVVWAEPCTHANIAIMELYFPYKYDKHHYIQCNLYGNAYLRDCSPDFYDPISHTCVDGSVFVDNLVGRK